MWTDSHAFNPIIKNSYRFSFFKKIYIRKTQYKEVDHEMNRADLIKEETVSN